MTKIDPIIAVKDVNASAEWYMAVFACTRTHGGDNFAVLEDAEGEVLLCLHKWGEHDHPTLMNRLESVGNGLILYYKTGAITEIRKRVEKIAYPIAEDMHLNTNSGKMEFSLRDPDGYYITVTEYHRYEG